MRQRDTISLLIHRGWPGSACDKTQVINILWIGGDLASLLHLFFCSLLIFGAVFAYSNMCRMHKMTKEEDVREVLSGGWRCSDPVLCKAKIWIYDHGNWRVFRCLEGVGLGGPIFYSSFFVLSWFHILLLHSLQGHGVPLNSFKPTCFSTILGVVQVVQRNQSIDLHACFRTSGLA